MPVTRLYLRTGGALSEDQGSSASTETGSINNTAFGEVLQFEREVGADVEGTSFPTNIPVNGLSGTLEYRYRVQRVNSSGTVQASSAYSAVYSTAGTRTDTLSLSTTWAPGDRLRISLEARRTGGHGNVSINVAVNDSSSWLEATLAEPEPDPVSVAPTPRGGSGGAALALVAGAVLAGAAGGAGGGAAAIMQGESTPADLEAVLWYAAMDETEGAIADLEVVLWQVSLDEESAPALVTPDPAGAGGGGGATIHARSLSAGASGAEGGGTGGVLAGIRLAGTSGAGSGAASGASARADVTGVAGAEGGSPALLLGNVVGVSGAAGAEGGGAGEALAQARPSGLGGAEGGGAGAVVQGDPPVLDLEVVIWSASLDQAAGAVALNPVAAGATGGGSASVSIGAPEVEALAVVVWEATLDAELVSIDLSPEPAGASAGSTGAMRATSRMAGVAGGTSSATGAVIQDDPGTTTLTPLGAGGVAGAAGTTAAGAAVTGAAGGAGGGVLSVGAEPPPAEVVPADLTPDLMERIV